MIKALLLFSFLFFCLAHADELVKRTQVMMGYLIKNMPKGILC